MNKLAFKAMVVVVILFVACSFTTGIDEISEEEYVAPSIDTTDVLDDLSLIDTYPFIANSYWTNGDIKKFSVDKNLSGKLTTNPYKSAIFGTELVFDEKLSFLDKKQTSKLPKEVSYDSINLQFEIDILNNLADITIHLLSNGIISYSETVKLQFEGDSNLTKLQNVKIQSPDGWLPINIEMSSFEIDNCVFPTLLVIPIIELIITVLGFAAVGGMVYVVVDEYLSKLHSEAEKEGRELKEYREVDGIIVVAEDLVVVSVIIGNAVCDSILMNENSLKKLKPEDNEYYFAFQLTQWIYITKCPISKDLARKVVRTQANGTYYMYNTWTKWGNNAAVICEPGNTSYGAISHMPHGTSYYSHYHVADSTILPDGHVKSHSFYGLSGGKPWN